MQRHRLDTVSLVAGGLFLLAGLRLLAGPVNFRALPLLLPLHWLGPAVLIVAGMALLVSLRSPTSSTRQDDPPGA